MLEYLSGIENLLTTIPPINTLASNLHSLELGSNRITNVGGVWCENNTVYEQLRYLSLRWNYITTVDAEVMKAFPGIDTFDLSGNSIMHFEDPTVYLSKLLKSININLGQNPLDCGPGLSWVAFARLVGRHVTCATPACKAGFALRAMREYMKSLWHAFRTTGICKLNHCSPMDSPHKGLVIRRFDIFFGVSPNNCFNVGACCQRELNVCISIGFIIL